MTLLLWLLRCAVAVGTVLILVILVTVLGVVLAWLDTERP